nr:lignin-forming anionic peroxidase-like [Ipomoea batatas]
MAMNIGKAVLEMNFTANSLPVQKKIVVEPMRALGKLFWRFRREWVFASKARGDESLGGKRRRIMGGRGRRDSLVTVAITSTILLRRRRQTVSTERRMAASLLRLHFHDCFVEGCDASILLDESPTIKSEKTALPNLGSVRGYDVIEAAKGELEKACSGIVSCVDVLSVAAHDATVAVGGLNTRDMVALSGAHTLGQAQCFLFRDRIYGNSTDIDVGFANTRRRNCPKDTRNENLAPLDLVTPNSFDNNYYKNPSQKKGLLQSDQVLFSGGATDSIVSEYTRNPQAFQADFASTMIKMSEILPLTGQNGIIRKVCGALN